jgi:hypothetical protein
VSKRGDRELGMTRRVTRRQFLDGLAVGTTALLGGTARAGVRGDARAPDPGDAADLAPYPPARTGLRGSHDGSYEVAHAVSPPRGSSCARPAGACLCPELPDGQRETLAYGAKAPPASRRGISTAPAAASCSASRSRTSNGA